MKVNLKTFPEGVSWQTDSWKRNFEALLMDPFINIICLKGTKMIFPDGQEIIWTEDTFLINRKEILGEPE